MKDIRPYDPYIDRELDNSLRMEWLAAGLLAPNGPTRKVAVVGGIVNKSGRLYTPDHAHLTAAIRALKTFKKPLGTGFALSWYNLLPPMKNDFLQAALSPYSNTPDTDALIILGLPKYGEKGWVRDAQIYGDNIDRQVIEDYVHTHNMTIVSRLSEPGIWPNAAAESGAKTIITWGGTSDEISTETFEKDWRKRFKILKASNPRASLNSSGDEGIGVVERIQDATPA